MAGSKRPPVKATGDSLYATEVNWLREQADRAVKMPVGYVNADGVHIGDPTRGPYRMQVFNDGDEVPPWSIFTIKAGTGSINSPRASVAKFGSGAPLVVLTNEDVPIKTDTWGWGRFVDYREPLRVRCLPTCDIGSPCGPKPDSYEASNEYTGLVAISGMDATYGAQWLMRAPEGIGFIGVVTTDISAASYAEGVPPTWTLGEGYVRLLAKTSEESLLLKDMPPPGEDPSESSTTPVLLKVYSKRRWLVPAGVTVRGTYVSGVGPVIDDNPGLFYCKTPSLGLAAGGSADCDILKMDGTTRFAGFPVKNVFSTAAAAQTKIIAGAEAFTGEVIGVTEDCPEET